jgi:acyl-coenzyme A thioesterase PaaI-like protein
MAPGDVPEINDRNFVGDMQVRALLVTPERSLLSAPLTPHVASPAGVASAGMMMTMIDIGGSDPALAACHPDWTATQFLSLHGAAWIEEGPVVVDNRLVRLGKKVIVVSAEVYDGRGMEDFGDLERAIGSGSGDSRSGVTLAGTSVLTFARIPRTAARDVDDYDPGLWVGQERFRALPAPPEGTLYERLGLTTVDAATGRLELARTSYVVNSIGTINGGAQAILIEAAAHAMRPGLLVSDMELHYLSQVKAGPAQSRGRVVRDAADHSVLQIELVDAGHHDQLLALATVTVRLRSPRTVGA